MTHITHNYQVSANEQSGFQFNMTGTGDAEVLLHLPALKPSRFPMSNSKTKNTNYDTEQRLRSPCFVLKPSSPHVKMSYQLE